MPRLNATEREKAIRRQTVGDPPNVVASTYGVHASIIFSFEIGSRPPKQPGKPAGDTHTFDDEIFNEGAHEHFDQFKTESNKQTTARGFVRTPFHGCFLSTSWFCPHIAANSDDQGLDTLSHANSSQW